MLGEDILKESVKKNIPIYLLHGLPIIPGCWSYKSMIGSLISPIEEIISELLFKTAEYFNTFHDLFKSDPFAEISK